MRKSTKKRARSQGRKGEVAIPPIPELDEHADAIRMLGRRSFDDLTEIGQRLARCRALLKAQRAWLAWLKLEFGWSRAHADRLIATYSNRDKLRKLSTLGAPLSALYLLTKASPELVAKIEEDIEAGERLSLHDIQQQARAERAAITLTSSEPSSPRPMPTITAPPEQPTQRHTLMTGDFRRAAAKAFAQELALFASYLTNHEPGQVAAALPAEKRDQVLEDADTIVSFLNELRRALWEGGRPKLVSGKGDEH